MILGHNTFADLIDLLASKDHAHARLGEAFERIRGKWAQANPQAFATFHDDYETNAAKYQAARNVLTGEIERAKYSLLPLSANPCGALWDALLRTDQSVPNTLSPGDFDDLDRRLRSAAQALGAKDGVPDYSGMPQPRTATDFDSAFLRNQTIKEIAKDGEAMVGTASAAATAIAAAAKNAANNNPFKLSTGQEIALIAGVTTFVLVGGYVALRAAPTPLGLATRLLR